MRWAPMILVAGVFANGVFAASPDIPRLTWEKRSDWISVTSDVVPAAIGDGKADDTAAIQAALDRGRDGQSVYLPPGIYRITRTLTFRGPAVGCLVVGHGRDTQLVWDGPEGGRMFWSNGVAYSRYVGLSWDGRGKAAVGFDHASQQRFETEVRHEHEAFRNFTGCGIRVGNEQRIASAEILYRNCLFENCGTALALLDFNDYDNTIDGCEFYSCGTGVRDNKGNFYARNCHFEQSREADFVVGSEHGSSIRRCTSVGSRRFVEERGTIAPLTLQDCHVAAWTDPDGAVYLNGSPVLMFDCSFTQPPSDRPPVQLSNPSQTLLISNNRPEPVARLVQVTPDTRVYVIPSGARGGTIASAETRFLHETVTMPGKVFDAVRDFGAKGDGQADDTAAVQAAIDAAQRAGQRAIAYLPTGNYRVTQTLSITGSDYTFGGSGFRCGLVWHGKPGESLVEVSGAQHVTLANLAIGNHDLGQMEHGADVRVTSPTDVPCHLILDEVYAYGMYQKDPDRHGLRFESLPAGSLIHAIHVQGNLRFTDSARATCLFGTSYEGTITVEGAATPREGLLGFLTRLATQSKPTLCVRDNHSIVMSDFYNEQSDQHLVFEGAAGQPEGAVTIQGPKMHMFSQEPVFTIRDYAGRIYYGQSQFYIEPKEPRFLSVGNRAVRLILAGHFWYDTKPRLELGPEVTLTLLGNRDIADTGNDGDALRALAAALDDLRRLGALDNRLSSSDFCHSSLEGSD
ncbi:MAG: glycosyl hydrolase family 28-related protein [Pirellulaceae bacterium]